MKKYAYVRVSTKEQNIDRQILALESYKIPKKNIYCDYQSGKNFERPAYQKLIRKLKKGTYIFPIIFPVTDRVRIFLPPFFFHVLQLC